jgi:hypothetical protein
MMIDVSRLRIAENVYIQPEALTIFQSGFGDDGAHDLVERAVIDVAERMGLVEQALVQGDLDQLRDSAHGLGKIGEQLGFLLLARVADDVIICAERGDISAIHSVTERLIRVGDASLAAAIDGATLPV